MLRMSLSTADAVILETETITAGRRGLVCGFTFNAAWDGLAKTVVVNGVVRRDVVLVGDSVIIPGECLATPNYVLKIGVCGKDGSGNIVIPTIWANFGKIQDSAQPSDIDPDEVTPDIVAQIQQNSSDALALAQDLQHRADIGEFNGRDGATGPRGEDGANGADGFSPTVEVLPATGGYMLDITDKNGTTHTLILNGQDGADGAQGPQGPTGATGAQGPAGAAGNAIWTGSSEDMQTTPEGKVIYFANLTGPSGRTPQVGDLVLIDTYYMEQISGMSIYDGWAILQSLGSIRGATGADGADGQDGADGSLIWTTTGSITVRDTNRSRVAASDLNGKSGATPETGDLVVGPPPGESGTATYLYTIRAVGTTNIDLNNVGSIRGAAGANGTNGTDGDDGSSIWWTGTVPNLQSSVITVPVSALSGKTGVSPAVGDIVAAPPAQTYNSTIPDETPQELYSISAISSGTATLTDIGSFKGSDGSHIWTASGDPTLITGTSTYYYTPASLSGPSDASPAVGDVVLADNGKQWKVTGFTASNNVKVSLLANLSSGGVFVCTYNSTTSAEIEAAYQAGKLCFAVYGDMIYSLTLRAENEVLVPGGDPITEKVFEFTALDGTSSKKVKLTDSTWSNSSTSLAKLASPTFTGTPKAPTAAAGTNTTQIATTAFVQEAIANVGLPSGGTAGQFLVKQSGTDYDAAWVSLSAWQGGNY